MSQPAWTASQKAAAIDRIGENLSLRSGAGCGKTAVLARRFTELLMKCKGEEPMRRFVALTFTDKAALEMSQRVRTMLQEFAAGAKGEDRRKILGWLDDIGQARISTIHSFCSTLLRAHAARAGVDPAFTVCSDELTTSQMLEQAADEAVLAAIEANRPDLAKLLLRVDFEQVTSLVRRLLNDRALWSPQEYRDASTILDHWKKCHAEVRRKSWENLDADKSLRQRATELAAIACTDPGDKLAVFRDAKLAIIESILDKPSARTAEAFAEMLELPGGIGSKKAWDDPVDVRHRLKDLMAAVAEYAPFSEDLGPADAQAAEAVATLASLSQDAASRYDIAKRQRGLLDFTDLLLSTRRLLEQNADLRRALAAQTDQMLIDECQDTDFFQVALLFMTIFPDADWKAILSGSHQSLPEGRIFFVGDAKQSIYRFRGAQVEVFEDLCRQLGAGKQESLAQSFRTHDAGVQFVNHLFGELMGEDYEPTTAKRKFDSAEGRGPSVEILLATAADGKDVESAKAAVAAQAAVLGDHIEQMLRAQRRLVWDRQANQWRPVRPGDIAILFSRMTNTLTYDRELARRDLPYYVVGGTGFFQQQEVFDILNALRVIDNPYDDIAFFGLLRSSMIGLDDNALTHIALHLQPPYLPALWRGDTGAVAAESAAASEKRVLADAIALLRELHIAKDALGIDRIIQRLLDETGYEATLLAQFQGRRMLGNVRMLLDQARRSQAAQMELADFVRQMSQRTMSASRYEQAAVAAEGEDVIRLMTIHKAKGLEFPVVYVPDLDAGRLDRPNALLARRDWGLTFKLPADPDADGGEDAADETDAAPLSYRLARLLEGHDQDREDIRKLYVALTRHEDHLVLVGAMQRTKEGEFRNGSYLAAIDPVLGLLRAVNEKRTEISYGGGKYKAALLQVAPKVGNTARRNPSPGRKLFERAANAREFADALSRAAGSLECGGCDAALDAVRESKSTPSPTHPLLPQKLIGPLPEDIGSVTLAVTALGDFQHCPMLYRWRHELRVPPMRPADVSPTASSLVAANGVQGRDGPATHGQDVHATPELDPATLGTLLHGCMEHLDLAQTADAYALVRQQAADMALAESTDLKAVAQLFEPMLASFLRHDLASNLRTARRAFREIDFVLDMPPALLRGQIDMLYQDAGGAWHIVDYKSDRIGEDQLQAHSERYRLQMLLYAAAAQRHLNILPADATLYYLRPAATYRFEISQAALETFATEVSELSRRLIAARRTGKYEKVHSGQCEYCQCAELCMNTRG